MIQIGDYQFEGPFQSTDQLKNTSGIYVILCKDSQQANNHFVRDVGESSDVKERVEKHDRKSCWSNNCSTTLLAAVLYTPGKTADQRRAIEIQLRDRFNPPCGEH